VSRQERGLGRGLDALFRNQAEPQPQSDEENIDTGTVAVRLLRSNPNQPRTQFDDAALDELAQSIKSQGIVQPILVRAIKDTSPQAYEIIAGERRWRAAQKAGLEEIPVLVRDFSDAQVRIVALIENLQREDLNPLEEARAIDGIQQSLNLSQEELAQKLGKSRSALANALRLLQLPETIRYSLESGNISAGHARALLGFPDQSLQEVVHRAILDKELSVRDAEAALTYFKNHGALPSALITPSAATSASRQAPRQKSKDMADIQKQLRTSVHPKATISGSTEMGRITLPYESARQLQQILSIFGFEKSGNAADAGSSPAAESQISELEESHGDPLPEAIYSQEIEFGALHEDGIADDSPQPADSASLDLDELDLEVMQGLEGGIPSDIIADANNSNALVPEEIGSADDEDEQLAITIEVSDSEESQIASDVAELPEIDAVDDNAPAESEPVADTADFAPVDDGSADDLAELQAAGSSAPTPVVEAVAAALDVGEIEDVADTVDIADADTLAQITDSPSDDMEEVQTVSSPASAPAVAEIDTDAPDTAEITDEIADEIGAGAAADEFAQVAPASAVDIEEVQSVDSAPNGADADNVEDDAPDLDEIPVKAAGQPAVSLKAYMEEMQGASNPTAAPAAEIDNDASAPDEIGIAGDSDASALVADNLEDDLEEIKSASDA
jgi:ParB family chromosome partitioning protein